MDQASRQAPRNLHNCFFVSSCPHIPQFTFDISISYQGQGVFSHEERHNDGYHLRGTSKMLSKTPGSSSTLPEGDYALHIGRWALGCPGYDTVATCSPRDRPVALSFRDPPPSQNRTSQIRNLPSVKLQANSFVIWNQDGGRRADTRVWQPTSL